jgi:tetratricopeptide (TPR) repeat protein
MKKTLILFATILTTFVAFAQSELTNAFNANKEGNFEEALNFINQASSNPKATAKEKYWRFRGDIYMNIATDSVLSMKYPNCFSEAMSSYKQCLAISEDYKEEVLARMWTYRGTQFNKAIKLYENKNFDAAGYLFKETSEICSTLKLQDSIVGGDLFNSGKCFLATKNPLCVDAFLGCVKLKYNSVICYSFLINYYTDNSDNENALKTISLARAEFPNDVNLLITEANYYITTKDFAKVNPLFKDLIKANPGDDIIYYQWGIVYEKLDSIDKSMECYEKALSLNPKNRDAHYNKCRLKLFDARDFARDCDNLRGDPFVKCMAESKVKFAQLSDDYVLLCQMFPEDQQIKKILQECYRKSGQPEKATELK